jgi:hypothetical protein
MSFGESNRAVCRLPLTPARHGRFAYSPAGLPDRLPKNAEIESPWPNPTRRLYAQVAPSLSGDPLYMPFGWRSRSKLRLWDWVRLPAS